MELPDQSIVTEYRKGGRPTVITDLVLSQLTFAFSCGASDAQACLFADISPASLYRYEVENPDFREYKHLLKERLILKARMNVAKKIEEGDVAQSNWYLERKAKDEFSTRSEHINANIDATQALPDEDKKRIANIIHANAEPSDN